MAAMVVAGGRSLKGSESVVTVDQIDPVPGQGADAAPEEPATSAILAPAAPQLPKPPAHSRAIDPEVVVPPELPAGELERVEPRAPLSDLALAGPPKPRKSKMPDGQDGTKLVQPVASAAGVIESKGYSVTVSGIDVVKDNETCNDDEGKSWACGARARTAFRAFLRGRTVACAVPSKGGGGAVSAECWVGNKDVGQWLVENGWARPTQGGPYAEAGDKARAAKKGIFGAAPKLGGLPALPAASPAPAAPDSILPSEDGAVMPPTDQPAPAQ
ncbi:thermonuclease family protein [Mesorhizobium sp. M1E.F.Ca.ET.045.02.1.1]|nr:thermonuclease family protein [Mesorhizobium sp. M1E.F.Ca.ET.045.02.1.1]AZO20044.1 thermonuclease family protein [Mesorhizobium sp. M1E.F.Ca.ET.045.02.1.1]